MVTGAYRGEIGPNNGAPFPRPAYDSGWVPLDPAEYLELDHNIGGDVSNYVIDLQFKDNEGTGIHNIGLGGDLGDAWSQGVHWEKLTSSSITIFRWWEDFLADQVRVRIWVYN